MYTNHLVRETSPYLLQHAHNPVEWYPWGEAALQRAAGEDKPILVSIGYAACHWCHVMEKESFENEATAAFMNEHFINIKIDREERPDLDHIYMNAVQTMTGSGGWPLHVFLDPESLRPFFCGTYYPPQPAWGRPSFAQLLQAVEAAWKSGPAELQAQAERLGAMVAAQLEPAERGEGEAAGASAGPSAGARAGDGATERSSAHTVQELAALVQPALETAVLHELTGGDAGETRALLQDFLASTAEDLAVLDQQQQAGDLHGLTRQAHKIKGAARLVGAQDLAMAAAALEAAGRATDWAKVLPLATDVHTAVERLRLDMDRRYPA